MKHVIWAAVALVAFVAGLYLGRSPDESQPSAEAWETPAQRAPLRRESIAARAGSAVEARMADLGTDAGWYSALDRLEALARAGEGATLQKRLLEALHQRARDGEVAAAAALLQAYLQRNPHDPEAHLLDSDLQQMQGRSEAALAPLLTLLGFADEPEVVSRARDRLRLLVNAREAHLANTGDTAGLIRLFEDLAQRDPTFDGHRLRLAHWQLRAGRVEEAERTLAETGTAGVDPQAREDLAAEVGLARTSVPLERRDGALHVTARVSGKPLKLLVDTGATTTAISRSRAAALGAVPTGERVQVRTANGIVESEMHRLADVRIGALHMDALTVLVLEAPLPQGVEGLLGMDVLARFPGMAAGALPGSELR